MKQESLALFAKSHRALRTARLCLDDEDPVGALNRAYYAAFYAVSAALSEAGEMPKTHKAAMRQFMRVLLHQGCCLLSWEVFCIKRTNFASGLITMR